MTNTPDNTHVKEEAELNGLEIIEESEFSTAIDFAPCKCMLVSDDADALIGLESHWKNVSMEYWMFSVRKTISWK